MGELLSGWMLFGSALILVGFALLFSAFMFVRRLWARQDDEDAEERPAGRRSALLADTVLLKALPRSQAARMQRREPAPTARPTNSRGVSTRRSANARRGAPGRPAPLPIPTPGPTAPTLAAPWPARTGGAPRPPAPARLNGPFPPPAVPRRVPATSAPTTPHPVVPAGSQVYRSSSAPDHG